MKKNIFYWTAGGVLLVTGVFFIPDQSDSMWDAVILSSIAAFLYLLVFSVVWLKEITSKVKRRAIAVAFVILVTGSCVFAGIQYSHSDRQAEILPQIRTYIEENLAYNYISEPLSETLKAYYTSGEEAELADLFLAEYDSLISDDNLFSYRDAGGSETFRLYLANAKEDSVVLIGESEYLEGMDSDFPNFSGNEGNYQVKGILTTKGVRYERDN